MILYIYVFHTIMDNKTCQDGPYCANVYMDCRGRHRMAFKQHAQAKQNIYIYMENCINSQLQSHIHICKFNEPDIFVYKYRWNTKFNNLYFCEKLIKYLNPSNTKILQSISFLNVKLEVISCASFKPSHTNI